MIILRQHNFARKDYEDLSIFGQFKLDKGRRDIANGLKTERSLINFADLSPKAKKFYYTDRLETSKDQSKQLLNDIRRSDIMYNLRKIFKKKKSPKLMLK